jgi:hypothetical protein
MTFEFVHSFGGYSGAPLRTPPDGYVWIKSSVHPRWWEVSRMALQGNYREKED